MPEVIETLTYYGMDINFIDPQDGLNMLDYILSNIATVKKLPNNEGLLKVWEEYKTRVIDVDGKSNKK